MILDPDDLLAIKAMGVKVCVTCHEYKLNYNRRWLQAMLRGYFINADLMFFFNDKDKKNAAKHAKHSIFWDDLTDAKIKEETNVRSLLRGFHSKGEFVLPSEDDQTVNLALIKRDLSGLDCEAFIGEIKYLRTSPFYYEESGRTVKGVGSITLCQGIKKDFREKKQTNKFQVSGLLTKAKKRMRLRLCMGKLKLNYLQLISLILKSTT